MGGNQVTVNDPSKPALWTVEVNGCKKCIYNTENSLDPHVIILIIIVDFNFCKYSNFNRHGIGDRLHELDASVWLLCFWWNSCRACDGSQPRENNGSGK